MRVISKRRLREFWDRHPESEHPLLGWYRIAKRADWANFGDIRRFAGSADTFGSCVIFNIGGNKFRLVVRVLYRIQRVYVVGVYTHAEYDEDGWKCECWGNVMIATANYQALIARFPLRPIRDKATLDAATSVVDELSRRSDLTEEETAYLEVLSDQIERYEDEHHPVPEGSPADVLQYLMDERGLNGATLAAETGLPKSLISEVLKGTRGLSKARIATLSEYFGVPAEAFL